MEPTITYRGMPHSPAMDARINELAGHLCDLNDRITSCHVVVAEADRHMAKGNLLELRVDVHIPGREIVATRQQNEDAYVAIADAFRVIERKLEVSVRRRRGDPWPRRLGNAFRANP